jgi:hypothetical protein
MSRFTTPLSVLAVAGASIVLAACGSSSGGSSASSTTASAGQGQSADRSAAFQKFQDCLKDNGVTLPNRGQRPGGGQGYGPPAGAGGTPPAGGGFANNPKFQAAMKACAKLRPQGLRGGRGGPQQDIKAFAPYLTCLTDQGLDIKLSNGFNALRDLKRDDPKVQAALKSCQPKIPQRPSAPQGTSTTATTT